MCSIANPVCDIGKIGGAIGSLGSDVASSVFSAVAKAFGDAAAKVTGWMWTVIAETTRVDLTGGWFHSTIGITATLAGLVILAIFVLELIKAVLRREPGTLGRAAVGVGAGLLGAAASIGVVEALLAATDALADGIVRSVGLDSLAKLGSEIAPAGAIASVAEPALILIVGLGYLIASFFVWAMFIARKAMIIIAAVFAPIAFCGAASHATSGWVRKWVEFTLALVFSKLVVVIIFTLALSLVGSPGSGMAAVGSLFSGLAMMVLACFAPWMLLKLVHFIGGDVMAAHHQGVHQAVLTAGSNSVSLARTAATKVAGVVGGSTAVGGGAASTAVTASSTAASRPASPGKSLTNNPVVKDLGSPGTGDAGGSVPNGNPPKPGGPSGPGGPDRPASATGPQRFGPEKPGPRGPALRPQPAPSPSS